MNPLQGWTLEPNRVRKTGQVLRRPECILAERNASLWVADSRGGVMHIAPSGEQRLLLPADASVGGKEGAEGTGEAGDELLYGSLPNGLAFDAEGNLVIANIGTDRVEFLSRSGESRVLCDQIEGRPMGKVNFVLRDRKERLWITVSTRANPWSEAICSTLADGYIALLDDKGLRIVADGLAFTNEIRFDAKEEFLYVAETTAKRVSRFPVRIDGSLGPREIYGPSQLGAGLVDGITFDAYGNLWCAMIFADRLVAITPEGDLLTLFEDGDQEATARFEAAFATGTVVPMDVMGACGGSIAPCLTSITFGGADLQTVYLGSLKGESISTFASPVAGLPMVHW
ncbi:SMP-30/gluconolactonase/LRE family protein [Paraburkholderia sp. DHOC27]|uniref:SMP-30/gluconolactonase/LRE family protein n=1 Tax=Paraburkholderia sp. DHOC27 TaxID=2303330 RepID=UPI000E3C2B15|nr:SMP-30/gluconolactonase/LRE family protein [Paraburkholderia sp. DHOC27]RFU49032.1 SMP-30/gluconolactonase/LRE family protein [Paraburkholderia sp. DHOC27]